MVSGKYCAAELMHCKNQDGRLSYSVLGSSQSQTWDTRVEPSKSVLQGTQRIPQRTKKEELISSALKDALKYETGNYTMAQATQNRGNEKLKL